jgi:putative colanic acid biosynthesis acetyltransferase WcaF
MAMDVGRRVLIQYARPVREIHYPSLKDHPPGSYDKGRGKAWQAAWMLCLGLFFTKWWFPRRFRPGVLRLFGATIGQNVTFRHNARVQWPWKLTIGDDVWIGEDSWLYNVEPITIGSDVCLSQGAFVCTGSHLHSTPDFRCDNGPITINDGAWLCAQSLVLRGVTVGTGAIIGARAVAARDVPDGGVIRYGQSN